MKFAKWLSPVPTQVVVCALSVIFSLSGQTFGSPKARLITTISRRPAPVQPARAPLYPVPVVKTAGSEIERRAFDMVNAERQRAGLAPLIWDEELYPMAILHSQDMAQSGFFSHQGQEGLDPWGRASATGVTGWEVLGENIACNSGYSDPASTAVGGWMRSAGHRENILNTGFTRSALGVAESADGRTYFTQVFSR